MRFQILTLGFKGLKLTCPMVKDPGKSFSTKIIKISIKWPLATKNVRVIWYPDLLFTNPKARSGQERKFSFFDWLDCE